MLFDIRPVHKSFHVEDRIYTAWFLTNVLGLKVCRHEEYKLPHSTACPDPLDDQLCKTSYAFGPETTHYAFQLIHIYKNKMARRKYGNDFVGMKIKSLEAIARAKAIGIEGQEESDDTFVIRSNSGRTFYLIDQTEHLSLDPYYEEIIHVLDIQETIHFWHKLMGVDIIDLKDGQLTLFFRNGSPRLTCILCTVPLVRSPGHLGFVMPRSQLKELSDLMMRSGMVVHQPFCKVDYEGRNSDYLVILKDPSGYYQYFHDEESFNTLSKFDPKAEARLNISLLKERSILRQTAQNKNVLEMKVLRHVEVSRPANTACPKRFANRWCKTVFGYGPEPSHFGIVLIYFYREVNCGHNEWIGATIKSLSAIARAKAMGFPMVTVDDQSFNVTSPSGRIYHLVDEEHHRQCDPLAEIYLRVTDLKESLEFWTDILFVTVISKTDKEFTLFFGNKTTRLRYVKTDKEVEQSFGHMSYTAPLSSLKIIQERCPEKYIIQPLRRISQLERGGDHLLILKDPNGNVHYFYDKESFDRICEYDPKAEIRWDLSVDYENRFQPPFDYLAKLNSSEVVELIQTKFVPSP